MPTKSASVIILSEDNSQVLLHQREDFRIWSLPGGRIESGETWEQAAIREAFEETGYEIVIDTLVGEYWRPQLPNGGDLMYVGLGRIVGGEPITRGAETLRVKWFPLDALPSSLFRFAHEYIHDALSGDDIPVKRTLLISAAEALLIRVLIRLRHFRNLLLRRR